MDTQFIAMEKLGVLEHILLQMLEKGDKRTRRKEFNRLARLAKDLGWIDKIGEVYHIGLTVNQLGNRGMLITFHLATTLEALLPASPGREEGA